MRRAFAAQQPQTTCTEAISSDCQKFKWFFPGDFTTSSLNLQFSFQGEPRKSKLCPGFVRSFKKPSPAFNSELYRLRPSYKTPVHSSMSHLPPCSSVPQGMQCTWLLLPVTQVSCSPSSHSLAASTVKITSFLQRWIPQLFSPAQVPWWLKDSISCHLWKTPSICLIKWPAPYQNGQLVNK